MRIRVDDSVCGAPYRYGDLSAVCGTAKIEKIGGVDVLTNPQLIVEVLSPSTEKYDYDIKFKQYQSIESFQEYLLIRQDYVFVTQFMKNSDSGAWVHRGFDDLEQTIKLESVDVEVSLSEIYRNVELAESAKRESESFNRRV